MKRLMGDFDLCLAAEFSLQPHASKDWLLSGKLYETKYREPPLAKEKTSRRFTLLRHAEVELASKESKKA